MNLSRILKIGVIVITNCFISYSFAAVNITNVTQLKNECAKTTYADGTIFNLAAGTYNLTSTLKINSKIQLKGSGMSTTIINYGSGWTGDKSLIMMGKYGIELHDITLDGKNLCERGVRQMGYNNIKYYSVKFKNFQYCIGNAKGIDYVAKPDIGADFDGLYVYGCTFENFSFRAFEWDREWDHLQITSMAKITFDNCTFKGKEPNPSSYRAISIDAGNDGHEYVTNMNGFEIKNCNFTNCSFALAELSNVNIHNNTIYMNNQAWIGAEPFHLENQCNSISISGNKVEIHNSSIYTVLMLETYTYNRDHAHGCRNISFTNNEIIKGSTIKKLVTAYEAVGVDITGNKFGGITIASTPELTFTDDDRGAGSCEGSWDINVSNNISGLVGKTIKIRGKNSSTNNVTNGILDWALASCTKSAELSLDVVDENNCKTVLYPNPGAPYEITMKFVDAECYSLLIFDFNGRVIYRNYDLSGMSQIKLFDNLNVIPGLYLAKVYDGQNSELIKFVIK